MGNYTRSRRAGSKAIRGRRRASVLATRLGVGLREGREAAGLKQEQASALSGISQPRWSGLERGLGTSASIETWAIAASTVGQVLTAFLERASGADQPRDIEHLKRQNALIAFAAGGGWHALPELAIDSKVPRSRSIDVALLRPERREAVACEIWNWFEDVGDALRSHDRKVRALAERLEHGVLAPAGLSPLLVAGTWRTAGLFVVHETRRNRRLVGDLHALFLARFPGSARSWLTALRDPATPMPGADGLLWSRADASLAASRLG